MKLLPRLVWIPLVVVAACIPLVNIAFRFAHRSRWKTETLILMQMVADLVLLTAMLHLSGGLDNPVFCFYVFHVIIAGIILPRRKCLALAALAVALFAAIGLLELGHVLPHYTLGLFPHGGTTHSSHSAKFVLLVTVPLAITLFGTAIFATSIMENLRARQRELTATTRLAAMGELAAGVAHEINNPIGIISGKIRLLLEKNPDGTLPPKIFHDLSVVQRNLERVERISGSLLNFCRPRADGSRRTDLNQVVRESVQLVQQRLADARITVRTNLDPDLRPVQADPVDLGQVLLNLLNNAADAMPRGGRLLLQTRRADGWATIEVGDTGAGIAADVGVRIFEPLFTTKPAGRGTGLGLAVSRELVARHGGTIGFRSTVGEGTTFSVALPAGGPS